MNIFKLPHHRSTSLRSVSTVGFFYFKAYIASSVKNGNVVNDILTIRGGPKLPDCIYKLPHKRLDTFPHLTQRI